MSVWETAWQVNVKDDPGYLLKIILVRAWDSPRGTILSGLITDLLTTFCRGLALPEIDPVVGAWLPLRPVERFEFTYLGHVLDTLCEMREYAIRQPTHYGMRWAQAGEIGAPQFYLHAGTTYDCAACNPDRVEPDLIEYVLRGGPPEYLARQEVRQRVSGVLLYDTAEPSRARPWLTSPDNPRGGPVGG